MTISEDLAPNLAAAVIVLGLLAYVTFGLRVYTRLTRHSWGFEDVVMSIGTVPLMVLTVTTTIGAFNGIGTRDSTFAFPGNQQYYESGLFWFFIYEVFYCTSIIPVKLSIAFMLNRIAQGRTAFVWTNYCIMGLCASVNMAAALYIIFQCNPVSAAWDSGLIAEGGHCHAPVILQDIYYVCTSVNIFTDWATALMPIPLLWNVQMNLNTKISVGAILGLGIFASLSGCIRLEYTVNLTSDSDYLYGVANILIWGYAEPSIGMIVGNLATLRPLFRHMLRLDSSSFTPPSNAKPTSDLPPYSHPYKSFDAEYEMGSIRPDRGGSLATSTQIRGGPGTASEERASSPCSNSDSQRRMLEKSGRRSLGLQGIVISREVDIKRS